MLAWGEGVIAPHPLVGALAFVLLSAVSVTLAFFSSAVLIPIAIETWGREPTIALLYFGWVLGGATAYTLARTIGRPLVRALVDEKTLDRYLGRISRHARFRFVLLMQLALPSELPGWVLGLAHVRFATYLAALAIAELPYAIGTVLVGEGLIEQRAWQLIAIGAAGAALLLVALRLFEQRFRRLSGRSARRARDTRP
jgi:uncharacterized membrane protein YdjX (TVP38/TMEM64 family)